MTERRDVEVVVVPIRWQATHRTRVDRHPVWQCPHEYHETPAQALACGRQELRAPDAASLGPTLRALRETAELRQEDVAVALEWSDSKVSRIETGTVGVTHGDIQDLLHLYGITLALDVLTNEGLVWSARGRGYFVTDVVGMVADLGALMAVLRAEATADTQADVDRALEELSRVRELVDRLQETT